MNTDYIVLYEALGTTAGSIIGVLLGLFLFIAFAYKAMKDFLKMCYEISRKLKRLYRIKKLAKK